MVDNQYSLQAAVWHDFLDAEKRKEECEPAFWAGLEREYGARVYSAVIFRLTRLRINQDSARDHIEDILRHHQRVSASLGRRCGLRMALFDYFINIRPMLSDPMLVECDLYQEREYGALRDELTGLFNRRFFNSILDKQVADSKRFGYQFSILMIDVDHFKLYNDRHGHLAGDRVLKDLAKVLTTTSRAIDSLSRYGGEEFALVLPRAGKDEAAVAAERHRMAVERFAFFRQDTQPGGNLTISVGAASYPVDAQDALDLVSRADAALYAAKRHGRNQVWTSGPERRRHPRVPFQAQVDYRYFGDHQEYSMGETRDISMVGMRLLTHQEVEQNRPLELIVHTGGQGQLHLQGQAVHVDCDPSQPMPYHLGVALERSSQADDLRSLVTSQFTTLH